MQIWQALFGSLCRFVTISFQNIVATEKHVMNQHLSKMLPRIIECYKK